MKTVFDALVDVRSLINVPELTQQISGSIWTIAQPANRSNMDIVLGSLGLDNEPMQQGVINVRLHVPNLTITVDGRQDSTMPNTAEFARVTAILKGLLDCQWRETFHTEIEDFRGPYRDADGSHYSNIMVNYYSLQEETKNI